LVENVALGLRPCATFSISGPSYLDVGLTTVHHLYDVGCCAGIALSEDQWKKLKSSIDQIDEALEEL